MTGTEHICLNSAVDLYKSKAAQEHQINKKDKVVPLYTNIILFMI